MSAPKKAQKEYIALKALCAKDGVMTKKGDKFTCTDEVYKKLKEAKAVA